MNRLACAFQPCAQHGLGRTLTIRARDVDHWRQVVLRISYRVQQTPDPIKDQIHHFGVQRHHPFQDDVGFVRAHASDFCSSAASVASATLSAVSVVSSGSGAGKSPLIAGDSPNNMRMIVINSSRIFFRCVTRSNMP